MIMEINESGSSRRLEAFLFSLLNILRIVCEKHVLFFCHFLGLNIASVRFGSSFIQLHLEAEMSRCVCVLYNVIKTVYNDAFKLLPSKPKLQKALLIKKSPDVEQ